MHSLVCTVGLEITSRGSKSILFLTFLLVLCCAMATDSDTESSEPDSGSKRTDVQLWSDLPRDFRRKFGIAGGALPAVEVLAFLVDSEQEARAWCDLSKK